MIDKSSELEKSQKEQTDEISRLESVNKKLTNDMDLERRESTDSLLTRGSIEVLRTHRENQKNELAALRTQQDERRPELVALRKQKKEQGEELAVLYVQCLKREQEVLALYTQRDKQAQVLETLRI